MSNGFEFPVSIAWGRHLVGGRPQGLIADPAQQELFDLGPLDPETELARGSLDTASLTRRLVDARASGPALTLDAIHWLPPLHRPSKILCFGKNFAAHAAEFGSEVPAEPMFFGKLADTLQGHGGPIELPHWVDSRIDHEAELGVILGFEDPNGLGAKDLSVDEAMRVVAGYTILNDVTARRMQGDDRGAQKPWLRCKSFDTFCPLGPLVLPADAFDPHDAAISCHVDDQLRQDSDLAKMVVDVPHGLAWLSKHTTLRPGDLVAMGTPEGVGPLPEGSVCRVRIEGLGKLSNPVRRARAPST